MAGGLPMILLDTCGLATAQRDQLTLLTSDLKIPDYPGVQVIWK